MPNAEAERYLVSQGEKSETVDGRAEAVEQAKSLSKEARGGVEVRSLDGSVRIRYRNGQMENYVCDAPGPHGRRRRSD
jgi:hypothetical protein